MRSIVEGGAHVSIHFHGNVSVLFRCVETGIGTTERNAQDGKSDGVIPAKNTRSRRDQKRSQDSDEVYNSQYLSPHNFGRKVSNPN